MANQKVLIVCSIAYSLINFRKDFIKALLDADFEVWCAAPDYSDEIAKEIKTLGAHTVAFNLQRKGLNPLKDFKTIGELKKIMDKLNIDFVYAYTIKPVIYASFAAQRLNLPVFSLITGLGFTFSGVSPKAKLLGNVSRLLYKRALKKNNIAIFQNPDDMALFVEQGILPKNKKSYVVNGSGINIDRFRLKNQKEFNKGGTVNFIYIGRLMAEKGIELFLEAAQHTHNAKRDAKFHIVGGSAGETEDLAIRIRKLHDNGVVVYHGVQTDVRPFLYDADIFVLPTYYREGVPRSILEALAVGMPIITTRTPGCKETVGEGKNGFLIPPKQQKPLIKAVQYFLDHPREIEIMGRESRKLAEQKFDVRLVNADILSIINEHIS